MCAGVIGVVGEVGEEVVGEAVRERQNWLEKQEKQVLARRLHRYWKRLVSNSCHRAGFVAYLTVTINCYYYCYYYYY